MMVLNRWTLVRTDPDQFAHPGQVDDLWDAGIEIDVPATVATVADVDDPDDHDWWHSALIEVGRPVVVEFAGLSFPASVFVDGAKVAECRSMFLPVRIELGEGRHEISVCFRSLSRWLTTRRPRGRWRSSLVASAGLRWARTTLLGRAPVYGNVPAPVGFWRPVVVTPARYSVRPTIIADASSGWLTVEGALPSGENLDIAVTVTGPNGKTLAATKCGADDGRFCARVHVSGHQLWWPRGYGAQSLYQVAIAVDGRQVAERPVGFRSIEAVSAEDFALRVNDIEVFCRGATWSPPDPVTLSVGAEVMQEHLATLAAAGANMVRIVGSLVPEQPEFWQACARLGILVWQDAMLSTFDPPAEITDVVVDEMVELLDSVSGNPALAVVSGGSESLQRPEMLGLERGTFAMDVIDSALPAVVDAHGHVPYVRSTPAAPEASDDLAIRPDTGVAHWFGVGGYLRPLTDVAYAGVRFAAESLAFANPPVSETIERHFGSVNVAGHDPTWKAGVPRDRGASWDFEDVRDFYVREVFGEDTFAVRRVDPERYLQLGRLAIAQAMLDCFAFWRRPDSGCSGALVLAGKDTCPGPGWGLMDVDGKPKPALAALARAWAPRAVILGNAGLSGLRIDVYNDTPNAMTGELELVAVDANGLRAVEAKHPIEVAARSVSTLYDSALTGVFRDLTNAFRFGAAPADGVEVVYRGHGCEESLRDVLIVHPRPGQVRSGIRGVATRCGNDWRIEVRADVTLRYVEIHAPGFMPSENYFHLLAGSPHCVWLRSTGLDAKPAGSITSIDSFASSPIEIA